MLTVISKILYWGVISEINEGRMMNKVTGETDCIIVRDTLGNYTFQVPNTPSYLAADADKIWFKANGTRRFVAESELVSYDLQSTLVKFDDDTPNYIRELAITNAGSVFTASERDYVFDYLSLPIMRDDSLNDFGHLKSNRGLEPNLWIPGSNDTLTYSTFPVLIPTKHNRVVGGVASTNYIYCRHCIYLLDINWAGLKYITKKKANTEIYNCHYCGWRLTMESAFRV